MDYLNSLKKSRFQLIGLFAIFNITIFTILRAVFFIISIKHIDNGFVAFLFSFFSGFVYDVAFNLYLSLFFALILLLLPERVYKSHMFKYVTYLAFVLGIFWIYFTVIGEWLFWDEFQVRFNFIAVDYLIYTREVVENIYQSYPIVKLLVLIFILSVITVLAFKKRIDKVLQVQEPFKKRAIITAWLYIGAFLVYLLLGQNLRDLPKNNYVKELGSNGPYQFVAAFRNNELNYKSFFPTGDDKELSEILKQSVGKASKEGGLYDISREVKSQSSEKNLNVILISVESLSAKFLTRFGSKAHITPFLDTLENESLFFTNFYATGTRTTRGLEAITLSIPPTPGRSVVKRPDNSRIYNIGKVFKDKGYDVAFIYGGRAYFDNMRAFYKGNGYRIIDQNNFKGKEKTFATAWGVCDEDLFNKTLKEADSCYKKNKKFFFHIMTTSNHRPYTYPEGKVDIPSGTGREGAVKYTDFALKQLLTKAKEKPWFKDTVFVITADHCASSSGKIGLPVHKYHIPLWIYSPAHIQPKTIEKLSSQVDLAPTVLAILNLNYKSWFFGNNILDENFKERALISTYQKLGLFENNKLVILSPGRKIEFFAHPLREIKPLKADKENPFIKEAMSYYQGSYHILKNRLNRY